MYEINDDSLRLYDFLLNSYINRLSDKKIHQVIVLYSEITKLTQHTKIYKRSLFQKHTKKTNDKSYRATNEGKSMKSLI